MEKLIVRTKKDYGKRACLIFLGAFLIVSPSDLFAQQENTNNSETENAAVYYSKAFDLLEYPQSDAVKAQLKEAVTHGWQKEYEELENILTENGPCFEELEKGLKTEKCDFNLGGESKYIIDKIIPDARKTRNLSQLLLLKGRHCEQQNNIDGAIDAYLSSLTFARHISQDNALISRMIAIAIEKEACAPLKQFLESGKAKSQARLRISGYLKKFEREQFSAKELVESEKDFFISTVKMLADGVRQRAEKGAKFNIGKKLAMESLDEELTANAQESATRYYGNFATAMETNAEKDWEYAVNEIEALKKSLKDPVSNVKEAGMLLYDSLTRDAAGSRSIIARKVIKSMLVMAIPDFKRAAENYYSTLKDLREVASLATVD